MLTADNDTDNEAIVTDILAQVHELISTYFHDKPLNGVRDPQ